MADIFKIILGICIMPFVVYFCAKFGTIGYFKAREFIENQKHIKK